MSGVCYIGETVASACRREVEEETGIELAEISLIGVYSDIDRDPRGHIVSVAFMTELTNETHARAGSEGGAPNGSKCATHLIMREYSPRPSSVSKTVIKLMCANCALRRLGWAESERLQAEFN